MAALPLRRVVVTGMGAVTPLGKNLAESWQRVLDNSKSGITSLEEALQWQNLQEEQLERELKIAKTLPCQVAAPVQWDVPFDTRTPRFVQLALLAGTEALDQAGLLEPIDSNSNTKKAAATHCLSSTMVHPDRIGVCIGSGMSGVREIVEAARTVETQGIRRLSPHFVPKVLVNSASGRFSLHYGLKGPNHAVSTACAAGTHALGDAMRCIQYHNADVMVAGGAEASIDPLSLAGFCRLKALSTSKSSNASRPFDKARNGFVMGEGSAILVLEELEHAKARNAPILAELVGYGLTGDAFHVTAPDPEGLGAERAMLMALSQATQSCGSNSMELQELLSRIGHVNAHATSTPKGDEIEAKCIDRIFAQQSQSKQPSSLWVSSTKGATGHLLGAAGAIEAAFTVLSLVDQTIPPTCNLEQLDDDSEPEHFQHVMHHSVNVTDMEFAMSNSFGFGGTNASVVFRRYHHDENQ